MPVLVSSPDFCSAPSSLLVVVGYMSVLCWCWSCGWWWCEFLVLSVLDGVQWGGGGEEGGSVESLPQRSHIDIRKNVNRLRHVVLSPHL